MPEDFISGILDEYDNKCILYTEFTKVTEQLIRDLLKANNLRVHSITSRIKERNNLENKLKKPDSACEKLGDITDVSGIRIITYFADKVDDIASVINTEFEIDPDNSVDKRAILDPDRFGYLSLHYVATLSPSRLQLTEYRQFSECKVEIQIRSILQHTWAEIEHDLGYKNKISIPKQLQRRFFQLAGNLELADELFTQLRRQIAEYETSVTEMVSTSPDTVQIDKDSLIAWYKNSKLVQSMDKRLASGSSTKIEFHEGYLGDRVNQLHYAGFTTIAELENFLKDFGPVIISTAHHILGPKYKEPLRTGISLYYLSHIKICHDGSDKDFFGFLDETVNQKRGARRSDWVIRFKKAYEESLANKK